MRKTTPMAMKWIMRAKEKGAIVIHVDPRFTRTSKVADIYVQILSRYRYRLFELNH